MTTPVIEPRPPHPLDAKFQIFRSLYPDLTPDEQARGAFGGDPKRKAAAVALAQAHADADAVTQQQYWTPEGYALTAHYKHKGCTAGCLTHAMDAPTAHAAFPLLYGIPSGVSWLADIIFESLPADAAPGFHVAWIGAPAPGADLSRVIAATYAEILKLYPAPEGDTKTAAAYAATAEYLVNPTGRTAERAVNTVSVGLNFQYDPMPATFHRYDHIIRAVNYGQRAARYALPYPPENMIEEGLGAYAADAFLAALAAAPVPA